MEVQPRSCAACSQQSDYFFKVTSKVTHYFLIWKQNSELLLQIGNNSYFVSHVLTDSSRVAMLREIGSKCRGVVRAV